MRKQKTKKAGPDITTALASTSFEEALKRLEEIVRGLESGEISLEESLRLFEEGIVLSKFCNEKLKEARQKVDILIKSSNGELKVQPFEPADEESE